MDPIERLDDAAADSRRRARDHRQDAVKALHACLEAATNALVCLIDSTDTEAMEEAETAACRAKAAAHHLSEGMAELDEAASAEQEASYKEYRSNLDSYHAKVL